MLRLRRFIYFYHSYLSELCIVINKCKFQIMRNIAPFLTLILIAMSCNNNNPQYPQTVKGDVSDDYFGVEVADPYRWLEDDNSANVADWVTAQNNLTNSYLEKIPFRKNIKTRLSELWNYDAMGTPFKEGGRYFYFKKSGLQNQSVLYSTTSLEEPATVLIDPNTLSEDGTVALSGISPSRNGKYLAYAISEAGSDWKRIKVLDIATGKDLDDEIRWVKFSGISWFNDGFFYSRYDAPEQGSELSDVNKNHKVYYHKLGTAADRDELVFQNKQHPLRTFSAEVTPDESFLIISETESTYGNTMYVKNLRSKAGVFTQITTGFEYEYSVVGHVDGCLYVHTNYKAPKYKLVKIDMNSQDIGNWVDVIAESKDVLRQCELVGGRIIATYIVDAKSSADIYALDGSKLGELALPGIGTIGGLNANSNDKEAYYTFSSYTMPATVYAYNIETNTSTEIFKPSVNFDCDAYETKQVFYTSKDGTLVPMFIVHKKGLVLDGNNPTLLYGYGGFNISMLPGFSTSRLYWLEQGGVYAIANLRGGGEYGENWYRAGTRFNKQNVFDDFIAAGEYLIEKNYTSSKRLAIMGGSNGGLLVGAVTNQRPDLFAVAVPQVGVMDMLRFHKFTIGWAWVNDYGSSEDSAQFQNLYRYSPLHNIKSDVRYPAILVTTADHDDRVVPAHSFKYIATMQEKNPNGKKPALIRIQTRAGHGAGTPTSIAIEEYADIYAFILHNMGVNPKQ